MLISICKPPLVGVAETARRLMSHIGEVWHLRPSVAY